jgi:hypothetical protein
MRVKAKPQGCCLDERKYNESESYMLHHLSPSCFLQAISLLLPSQLSDIRFKGCLWVSSTTEKYQQRLQRYEDTTKQQNNRAEIRKEFMGSGIGIVDRSAPSTELKSCPVN